MFPTVANRSYRLALPLARMAGFRARAFDLLGGMAQLLPIGLLRSISRQGLVMPVYHLVSDVPVDHVRHLYPIRTTSEFGADLDFLLRHFTPVDLHQIIASATDGRPLPKNAFFLSFDDGLREFHDVIAPILLRKGVPATCFLNSDFIDNRGLMFRYKVSLALNALGSDPALSRATAVAEWSETHGHSGVLAQALPTLRHGADAALDELMPLLGIDIAAFLSGQRPYLTSQQISSLIHRGFHFGAHSIDHPEYRFLSMDEQLHQTLGSMDAIRQQFGLDYRAFAFPFTDFGVTDAFFQKVFSGDDAMDVTFGCAGLKREPVARHFQRIPIEQEGQSAERTIRTEYLYHLLKAPLGRHITRRS
ncbi:MAG: polysaccharide deacetylase family protein [Flavobacteriales bacterium]|nr:polysaccharide deacetylase family protein [Flavobacteriales bacterium]